MNISDKNAVFRKHVLRILDNKFAAKQFLSHLFPLKHPHQIYGEILMNETSLVGYIHVRNVQHKLSFFFKMEFGSTGHTHCVGMIPKIPDYSKKQQ